MKEMFEHDEWYCLEKNHMHISRVHLISLSYPLMLISAYLKKKKKQKEENSVLHLQIISQVSLRNT